MTPPDIVPRPVSVSPWKSKPRWLIPMAILVTVGCILFGIVVLSQGPTYGITNVYEMEMVILKHIPSGTSVEDAKQFMLKEGFRCDQEFTNHRFTMRGGDRLGLDFVYCERTDSAGLLEVRIWGVALVMKNRRVTDVLVRTGVFGL